MATTCNRCGSDNVAWATSKTGRPYLINITSATNYDNGARYPRGPHFRTCDAHKALVAESTAALYREFAGRHTVAVMVRYLPAVAASGADEATRRAALDRYQAWSAAYTTRYVQRRMAAHAH